MTCHSLIDRIVGLAISSSVPSSALVSTPWCVGLGGVFFIPFISLIYFKNHIVGVCFVVIEKVEI